MMGDEEKAATVPDFDDPVGRAFRAYLAALAAREARAVRMHAFRRNALVPDMVQPLREALLQRWSD